jgi:hypothetical protein
LGSVPLIEAAAPLRQAIVLAPLSVRLESGLTRVGGAPDIPSPFKPVRWQSGDAADCKSAYAGSIPARTSTTSMT